MYGSRIYAIRTARGYSQDYVARQVGIPQTTFSKIEKDHVQSVDDDLLGKIAKVLGVSVEDIKSPYPIIMSFHDSPYSGQISHQENHIDSKYLEALIRQIEVKDSHIDRLLKIIEGQGRSSPE